MWKDLSPVQQGWLAGMLDGEGSFIGQKDGGIIISMATTDLDVIRKVAGFMGGNVSTDKRSLLGLTKPAYRTAIHGVKAIDFMVGMFPYLCRRRQAQVIKALSKKVCMFTDMEPLSIP